MYGVFGYRNQSLFRVLVVIPYLPACSKHHYICEVKEVCGRCHYRCEGLGRCIPDPISIRLTHSANLVHECRDFQSDAVVQCIQKVLRAMLIAACAFVYTYRKSLLCKSE